MAAVQLSWRVHGQVRPSMPAQPLQGLPRDLRRYMRLCAGYIKEMTEVHAPSAHVCQALGKKTLLSRGLMGSLAL